MLFKNTASQKISVIAIDVTTGKRKTGDSGNITASISKDGGAWADLTDTSATEEDSTKSPGVYQFDISQSETNADHIRIMGRSSTSNIEVMGYPAAIPTRPPNAGALSIDSSGRVDVIKVNGTSQTARDLGASVLISSGTGTGQLSVTSGVISSNVTQFGGTNGTFSSGRPEVNTTHAAGTAWGSGAITAASIATDAITAGKIAADAIGASELASDAVTEIQSGLATSSALSTLAGKFTGITSVAEWLGLIAGKQTGNSTARTEIRATGAGSGTFNETTDSIEALRDRGDAAWTTATGFSTLDAAGVRTAVGLASANLDTQLGGIATDAGTAASNAADTLSAIGAVQAVTDKLSDTLEDSGGGNYVFTVDALANGPAGGGGGGTDWTTTEKNQIRYRLGIDGSTATPSATPTLPVDVNTIKTQSVTCSGAVTILASVGMSSPMVHTSGKPWVLDGSGNAIASAASAASIKADTDIINSAFNSAESRANFFTYWDNNGVTDGQTLALQDNLDAAVSSRQVSIWSSAGATVNLSATTVGLNDAAITDAKFAASNETTAPTGPVSILYWLGARLNGTRKTVRDIANGLIKVYRANGSTVWTSSSYTVVDDVSETINPPS